MADKLSCFVITGFGEKTDLTTGRKLNLNVVYEKILKPVCDSFTNPVIDCFRACDKLYTGTIDSFMYKWILEADIAIADISTLNPNAIYELGVRYALKPFSTIVISESNLSFPFDFSHILIQKYVHGGNDIEQTEVMSFSDTLKRLIQSIFDRMQEEGDDCNDSPVYTFLKDEIIPPKKKAKKIKKNTTGGWSNALVNVLQKTDDPAFTSNLLDKVSQSDIQKINAPEDGKAIDTKKTGLLDMYQYAFKNIGLDKDKAESTAPYYDLFHRMPPVNYTQVSPVINELDDAIMKQKNKGLGSDALKDLPEVAAILDKLKTTLSEEKLSLTGLMSRAEEKKNDNSLKESLAYFALALERDPGNHFITQRIVLLTYKLKEPDELTALKLAESILLKYLRPDDLIDVETYGLAGAIYKRLSKFENETDNINKSCKYYEKGFIVCNDYYNGINAAFMYLRSATKTPDKFEKIASYSTARKTWKTVIDICDADLAKIEKDPANKDRVWILQSKAQAILGLNEGKMNEDISQLIAQVTAIDTKFTSAIFIEQNNELAEMLDQIIPAI
ncbi:MAG TPA: tetratricopeptide repeat-containing protein [Chitinophagaceae bacterium]|jgi:hypothetical protein|nr:tetratricopeptide repeat-containing protein [Chitinophagaceae bacterium]